MSDDRTAARHRAGLQLDRQDRASRGDVRHSKVARVTGIGRVVQVVLGPDLRAVSAPPPSGSSVNVQIDHTTSSSPTKLPQDLSVTNAADTSCE